MNVRQEMLDGAEEPSNGMSIRRLAQIVRSHMQVDLCARDHAMAQQITDGHEVDAFTHEVRGKRVSQPMR
jgi:hypothetical protein